MLHPCSLASCRRLATHVVSSRALALSFPVCNLHIVDFVLVTGLTDGLQGNVETLLSSGLVTVDCEAWRTSLLNA